MLHLLTPKAEAPLLAPLAFGPPVLNAFDKVAEILRCATSPPTPPPATATAVTKKSPVLPLAANKVPAITLPRVALSNSYIKRFAASHLFKNPSLHATISPIR